MPDDMKEAKNTDFSEKETASTIDFTKSNLHANEAIATNFQRHSWQIAQRAVGSRDGHPAPMPPVMPYYQDDLEVIYQIGSDDINLLNLPSLQEIVNDSMRAIETFELGLQYLGPGEQAQFLSDEGAAWLMSYQKETDIDAEVFTDQLISILSTLNTNATYLNQSLLAIAPCLITLLHQKEERDRGWYESLANITSLLTKLEASFTRHELFRKERLLTAFIFHMILAAFVENTVDFSSSSLARRASALIVSQIQDIIQKFSKEKRDKFDSLFKSEFDSLFKSLIEIQAIASLKESTNARIDLSQIQNTLFPKLNFVAEHGVFIDAFTRISFGEDDSAETVLRYLLAGLVRAQMGAEDRCASSFFNAALADRRSREHDDQSNQKERDCFFAVANAMGLFWALELNPQIVEALTSGDGHDCAVNMFGGLADYYQPRPDALTPVRGDIANLAGLLYQARAIHGLKTVDFKRMDVSYRQLGIDSMLTLEQNFNRENMKAATVKVLWDLLDEYPDFPSTSKPIKDDGGTALSIATSSKMIRYAYERAYSETEYNQNIDKILAAINSAIEDKPRIGDRVKKVYGDWSRGKVFDDLVNLDSSILIALEDIGIGHKAVSEGQNEYFWKGNPEQDIVTAFRNAFKRSGKS